MNLTVWDSCGHAGLPKGHEVLGVHSRSNGDIGSQPGIQSNCLPQRTGLGPAAARDDQGCREFSVYRQQIRLRVLNDDAAKLPNSLDCLGNDFGM